MKALFWLANMTSKAFIGCNFSSLGVAARFSSDIATATTTYTLTHEVSLAFRRWYESLNSVGEVCHRDGILFREEQYTWPCWLVRARACLVNQVINQVDSCDKKLRTRIGGYATTAELACTELCG